MAFTDAERQRNLADLKHFLQRRRPPENLRERLDIGYAVVGQTIDVFEIRPDWREPTTTRHTPVARMRYVRTRGHWLLYWMRGDLKWHAYEPGLSYRTLRQMLDIVDRDEYGCFFG